MKKPLSQDFALFFFACTSTAIAADLEGRVDGHTGAAGKIAEAEILRETEAKSIKLGQDSSSTILSHCVQNHSEDTAENNRISVEKYQNRRRGTKTPLGRFQILFACLVADSTLASI